MTKRDKLIEGIETTIQIKYPSSSAVEEIIDYVKQNTIDIQPAMNIAFKQNGEGSLKIIIESIGTVELFLKTLDTLLIYIREKEEMLNKKSYQSETR
ncbi:MAG: hypothetical protein ACFFCD_01765 [Promethearchaeota archaeon]